MRYITVKEIFYMNAHANYMNGLLMERGGVNDQFAKVFEAINAIAEYKGKRANDGK